MRRHEQAGSPLEYHEFENQEHFGGEYNLGVSPRDILRMISPFAYSVPDHHIRRGAIQYNELRAHLINAPPVLTPEQQEALPHISIQAGRTFENSLHSLKLGYFLYMRVASETDKLCQPLPYDFQDMLNNSPAYGQSREILALDGLARQEVPLLCGTAEDIYPAFTEVKPVDYLLLRGGIGLAYQHCYTVMQAIDSEVASHTIMVSS